MRKFAFVISTPSHIVIPSGARNLVNALRAGSGRNLIR
jgi:hypothetical protein